MDHVRQAQPDVLVLAGPFVDAKHRLLDPACAGMPGGFSNGEPPDSLVRIFDDEPFNAAPFTKLGA
jgi:hypothetical protein